MRRRLPLFIVSVGLIVGWARRHVLRRQPDGSWKISHDMWSTNTMAEGM